MDAVVTESATYLGKGGELIMVRTASTMLPLGTNAPPFALTNIDGRTVSLAEMPAAKGIVVVFMCNHCPYVKHVAPELARVSAEYMAKGIDFVGISFQRRGSLSRRFA